MHDVDPEMPRRAGWYWHPHSQRPAYVFRGAAGWQARFLWRDLEDRGSIEHADLLNSVAVDLPIELYLQLVPLFRRPTVTIERRQHPAYPLVLPCQRCGKLTPSSFRPVGDGTWVATPLCDAHAVN